MRVEALTPDTKGVAFVSYPRGANLIATLAEYVGQSVPIWISDRETLSHWQDHHQALSLDVRDGNRVDEIDAPCVLVDPSREALTTILDRLDGHLTVVSFEDRVSASVPDEMPWTSAVLEYTGRADLHRPVFRIAPTADRDPR